METKNNFFTIALFFLMAWAGCNGTQSQMENAGLPADSIGVNTDTTVTTNEGGQDEAAALAMLNAVNQHEIDAATEAQKKNSSKPVMDYANMLHRVHSENLAKTNQLAGTMNMVLDNNEAASTLKQKGASTLASLKSFSGKEFENAYLDAMIKGHTEALSMIDNQLLPIATSDAVKQHFSETRGHVAMHLDEAKKLKGTQ